MALTAALENDSSTFAAAAAALGETREENANDGAKFAATLLGTSKAATKLKKSTRGKVPKSCRKNTMDLAKALGIMGFTSTRWAEKHKGNNPKEELDKAQFAKLMKIQKKKDQLGKELTAKEKLEERRASSNYGRVQKELTPDDEIRQLHEAYQFLLKKFSLGETMEEKQCLISPFMKMSMETDEDWKLAKQKVQDNTNENEDDKANENGTQEEETNNEELETNGNEIDVKEAAKEAKKAAKEAKKAAKEAKKALEQEEQEAKEKQAAFLNSLLAQPEPELKRQKSLKRKSIRRKSSAVGGSKSARY